MKTMLKSIIAMLCLVLVANTVNAQKGKTPHISATIPISFQNDKAIPIWVGPHSDSKENSGFKIMTEIKPGESKSFEVFPDSVLIKGKAYARLAFKLTNDKANKTAGQNYLIPWSKLKSLIHVDNTEAEAGEHIADPNKERAVGFLTNEMLENTTACILKNESGVAITFTDKGHPFYGKTLGTQDSIAISATLKRKLVSTGFKDSKISIIKVTGDDPIKTSKTLPIYENSSVVVLTPDFFDFAVRNTTTKVYPMKIKAYSPIDMTIEGAYDSKGTSTIYVIPGGKKGEKGQIVYLKYGENYVNLKFFYKAETSQALILRATERGTFYFKFMPGTDGEYAGKVIADRTK